MIPTRGLRDVPSNESDDWVVALATAACFAAAYAGLAFSDDGTVGRTAAPVVSAVGDVGAFALALVAPAATCATVLTLRGRPRRRAALFAALTALLTAAGWVVGFVVLFFAGVTG